MVPIRLSSEGVLNVPPPCPVALRSMARSAGDDEARAQATRFEAEVERKAKTLLKANRKLATEVSRWVDESMTKHEEAPSTLTGDGGEEVSPPCSPVRGGGVEEAKGDGGRSSGGGTDGVTSWLGSWLR